MLCKYSTLNLNWRARLTGGNTQCLLCNEGREETVNHFVKVCVELENIGSEYGMENEILETILLLNGGDIQEENMCKRKVFLNKIWIYRKNIIEQ